MIRVLVISPYPSVRAGIRSLLGHSDIAVVWEGAGANDILDPWPVQPDLAVVDGASGPAIFGTLAARVPELGIIVLGADASHLEAASGVAARGFLSQDANADELEAAVRTVALGLTVIAPALLAELGPVPVRVAESGLPDTESLTPRETEVLQLLARGLPNKTIAAHLNISEHTAKFHVSAVLAKLGAASRTEAVTIAARRGLLML
jgi:DNA-binding NarL/FixJ family response regulator